MKLKWYRSNRGEYNNAWKTNYVHLQSGYRVGLAIHKVPGEKGYHAEGALLKRDRVFDAAGAPAKTLAEAKKKCEEWLKVWTERVGAKK